ncbi:MAG: right-handed parallel beta-helix repeat-containing protein, partial [Bacteroidaceae bacterium]|nr:right-handed parallel beta-helix repeat-containing protein [Bacteroidaceae bacterium]
MRKILLSLSLGCMMVAAQAQRVEHGLVGFAATPGYGLEGTIGGGLGEVVRVTDEAGLRRYCAAEEPYTILFEGTIKTTDERDIDVASDKTIIGLGGRAVLDGIGFRAEGVSNVVIRGFTIRNAHQDAIAFRSSHHVWVDHCDLGSSDDGLLDFTIGSDLLTASWNRFLDHNKVSVCNSGTQHAEDVGRENVSYHHNVFLRTTQRNPRIGYGRGHVWNNYYEEVKSYCVGYFCGARVVVEGNSFHRCKTPLKQMYSADSTSAFYAYVSSVDNLFNECSGNTQGTGEVFDAGSLYDYTMTLDKAADVQARVTASAGPVEGLEYDLIPLPNHGRTDYAPADGTLRWSKAPDAVEYQVYLSTSPTIRP